MTHKTCPVCSSPRHFLCSARVKFFTSTQDRDHTSTQDRDQMVRELKEGDMLVLIMTDVARGARTLPSGQLDLDRALMSFEPAAGATLLIDNKSADGTAGGHILLLGCGKLACHDIGLSREVTSPAVRAACHAFDEALLCAANHKCRRLVIDAHEMLPDTGEALAAALHCRLQLAQAQNQSDSLEEVHVLVAGGDSASLSLSASCKGPLCRSCPFVR